jgi:hypothetical protein
MVSLFKPVLNQRIRCWEEPCVNDSGLTLPVDIFCRRSSPYRGSAIPGSGRSNSSRIACSFSSANKQASKAVSRKPCSLAATTTCRSRHIVDQALDLNKWDAAHGTLLASSEGFALP